MTEIQDTNRLGAAVSPYLLQHRDNPVHWRQWSPETLAQAVREDKPILLSVGYAACHWCHVMAHESFENEATAAVMNRLFVNVKVDREERPDIDHLYMSALHAMGEQGGWPMTMFLTPEGKPFYGGTYFPPMPGHGRPGFVQLLEAVGTAWIERRPRLEDSAQSIKEHLGAVLSRAAGPVALDPDALNDAAARIAQMVDPRLGGMKGAPKFPNAPYFELLARSGFPHGPQAHRAHVLATVTSLCEGGIYDHLGGGLHRYSVDAEWLVPHFEKMLYDNAQFLRHLVWAWRSTGKALFRRRIEETVGFLSREMVVAGGGLAASLDADSLDAQGHLEEGAHYVWTMAEIDAVLGPDRTEFRRRYDVSPTGNWEGRTVLSRLAGLGSADAWFDDERAALLDARAERPRPARDDKVLADWNGLAIRALAEVFVATGHARALQMARDAFGFAMTHLVSGGRLQHAARGGATSGPALSSDYGAMIAAAAQLFVATRDPAYLEDGRRLAEALEAWHADGEGGHWMTASDADDVMIRLRGDGDDATPSPTALVLEGLALLSQVTGDLELGERAMRAAGRAASRIAQSPASFPGILSALHHFDRGSELALFGFRSNPGFAEMEALLRQTVDLSRLDLVTSDPAALPEAHALSAFRPQRFPTAILCRDRSCRPPVEDSRSLADLLGA